MDGASGSDKSILVVSDGGFEDTAAAAAAIPRTIRVYTLGVGTTAGAPIPADGGGFLKDSSGQLVIAKREDGKLQAIANAGHGITVTAAYGGADTATLMDRIDSGVDAGGRAVGTVRVWQERFYLPALLMALLLLPWFRRGFILPALILFLLATPLRPAQASWLDWFRNPAQQGRAALNHGDYQQAAQKFDTPYRRGIAEYKAGDYQKATQDFDAAKATPVGENATLQPWQCAAPG